MMLSVRSTIALVAVVATAACQSPASAPAPTPPPAALATCPRLSPPSVVVVPGATGDEVHERFDLPDTPELLRAAPLDAIGVRYRRGVIARLGADVSPRTLMARQNRIMGASKTLAPEMHNGR